MVVLKDFSKKWDIIFECGAQRERSFGVTKRQRHYKLTKQMRSAKSNQVRHHRMSRAKNQMPTTYNNSKKKIKKIYFSKKKIEKNNNKKRHHRKPCCIPHFYFVLTLIQPITWLESLCSFPCDHTDPSRMAKSEFSDSHFYPLSYLHNQRVPFRFLFYKPSCYNKPRNKIIKIKKTFSFFF